VTLRSVAHLGTWIHAKVLDGDAFGALELLAQIHPTAAVGGIPRERGVEVIDQLEGEPRGLFGGAVGWLDANGSGEWWLAIRGIELDRDHFLAWAGAGIVADSDPIAEREETRDKLAAILVGLGPMINNH
jgi:isochorismate synthase